MFACWGRRRQPPSLVGDACGRNSCDAALPPPPCSSPPSGDACGGNSCDAALPTLPSAVLRQIGLSLLPPPGNLCTFMALRASHRAALEAVQAEYDAALASRVAYRDAVEAWVAHAIARLSEPGAVIPAHGMRQNCTCWLMGEDPPPPGLRHVMGGGLGELVVRLMTTGGPGGSHQYAAGWAPSPSAVRAEWLARVRSEWPVSWDPVVVRGARRGRDRTASELCTLSTQRGGESRVVFHLFSRMTQPRGFGNATCDCGGQLRTLVVATGVTTESVDWVPGDMPEGSGFMGVSEAPVDFFRKGFAKVAFCASCAHTHGLELHVGECTPAAAGPPPAGQQQRRCLKVMGRDITVPTTL